MTDRQIKVMTEEIVAILFSVREEAQHPLSLHVVDVAGNNVGSWSKNAVANVVKAAVAIAKKGAK